MQNFILKTEEQGHGICEGDYGVSRWRLNSFLFHNLGNGITGASRLTMNDFICNGFLTGDDRFDVAREQHQYLKGNPVKIKSAEMNHIKCILGFFKSLNSKMNFVEIAAGKKFEEAIS